MKAVQVLTLPRPATSETPVELTTLNDGDRVIATEIGGGYVTLVVVSRKHEFGQSFGDPDPEDGDEL